MHDCQTANGKVGRGDLLLLNHIQEIGVEGFARTGNGISNLRGFPGRESWGEGWSGPQGINPEIGAHPPGTRRYHSWEARSFSARLSHAGSCTPHEVKDYGYYGKDEKDVDEECCDMKDEKSA